MKKGLKVFATILMAGVLFGFAGCKTEADSSPVADTTPPAKVTVKEDGVTAANSKAVLTWTNPADKDFYATRVTVTPTVENGNSSLVIEGKASEKASASFEGLVNGTEYTFKLYSMDKSHNASEAVEVKATPKDTSDKTAPAEVTNLTATAKDKSVLLTWTDVVDTDKDIYGYEVSWTGATESRAATALSSNSIVVAQGVG